MDSPYSFAEYSVTALVVEMRNACRDLLLAGGPVGRLDFGIAAAVVRVTFPCFRASVMCRFPPLELRGLVALHFALGHEKKTGEETKEKG